jgi:hypothetical protein
MEPEHSLPRSQEPATGPSPKPDESSPYILPHPIPLGLIFTLFPHLHLCLRSPLSSGFLTKTLHILLSHAGYVPCQPHFP